MSLTPVPFQTQSSPCYGIPILDVVGVVVVSARSCSRDDNPNIPARIGDEMRIGCFFFFFFLYLLCLFVISRHGTNVAITTFAESSLKAADYKRILPCFLSRPGLPSTSAEGSPLRTRTIDKPVDQTPSRVVDDLSMRSGTVRNVIVPGSLKNAGLSSIL
ncbi:hypothetical protein KCV03_g158, partial [Aureobasidium melanogenum]